MGGDVQDDRPVVRHVHDQEGSVGASAPGGVFQAREGGGQEAVKLEHYLYTQDLLYYSTDSGRMKG
jgi:hypothetical protein